MIFGGLVQVILVSPDTTASSASSICSFVHCFLFTFILFEGDWNTRGADLARFRLVNTFRCS